MTNKIILVFCIFFASVSCISENRSGTETLYEEFVTPPREARPMVWWHWMNGNISKEGIREDLEWMHRAGIGGFHLFDAGLDTPQIVDNRLLYMSEDWKDALCYALRLADSLGLETGIPSSPGWSSTGGPWVKPEDAMKKIVWRESYIKGGIVDCKLPDPYTTSGNFQNLPLGYENNGNSTGPESVEYYEDVAIIAARIPSRETDCPAAKVTSSSGNFTLEQLTDGDLTSGSTLLSSSDGYSWIQYSFPVEQEIRALTLCAGDVRNYWHSIPSYCLDSLQTSDDGIHFRTVMGIPVGSCVQQTISFNSVKAKHFRLKHKNPTSKTHYLDDRKAVAPSGSYISEFVLHPCIRVNHSEEKAAFASAHDCHLFPTVEAMDSEIYRNVIDLTPYFSDGRLRCTVPEGNWKIWRIGASLTGKKIIPLRPKRQALKSIN